MDVNSTALCVLSMFAGIGIACCILAGIIPSQNTFVFG